MYQQFKKNLTKKNSKKPNHNNNKTPSAQKPKPQKPKPEWDSTITNDQDKYKLSQIEQIQKKVSLMSKNRLAAKEEWQERQRKLKEGILDEETSQIYNTARQSKNLNIPSHLQNRKNLSQMIDFNKSDLLTEQSIDFDENSSYRANQSSQYQRPNRTNSLKKLRNSSLQQSQKPPHNTNNNNNNYLQEIQSKVKETREFINKIDNCHCSSTDPIQTLKANEYAEQKIQKENHLPPSQAQKPLKNKSFLTENFNKSQLTQQNNNSNSNLTLKESQFTQDNTQQQQEDISQQHQQSIQQIEGKPVSQELESYFKSLSKIEDTIKFMENNIVGNKSPQKKEPQQQLQLQKEKENFETIFETEENNYINNKSPLSNILQNNFLNENNNETKNTKNNMQDSNQPIIQNQHLEQISFSLTDQSQDYSNEKNHIDLIPDSHPQQFPQFRSKDSNNTPIQIQQQQQNNNNDNASEFSSLPISEIKDQNNNQNNITYQEYSNEQSKILNQQQDKIINIPQTQQLFQQQQQQKKHVHFDHQFQQQQEEDNEFLPNNNYNENNESPFKKKPQSQQIQQNQNDNLPNLDQIQTIKEKSNLNNILYTQNLKNQQQQKQQKPQFNDNNNNDDDDIIPANNSQQQQQDPLDDDNLDLNKIREMLEQTKQDLESMNTSVVSQQQHQQQSQQEKQFQSFSNLSFNNQDQIQKPTTNTQLSSISQQQQQQQSYTKKQPVFHMTKNPQDVVHIDSVAQGMEFLLQNTVHHNNNTSINSNPVFMKLQQQSNNQFDINASSSSYMQNSLQQQKQYNDNDNINNIQRDARLNYNNNQQDDEDEQPRQFNIIQQSNFNKNLQNYQKKSFTSNQYSDSMSIKKHI